MHGGGFTRAVQAGKRFTLLKYNAVDRWTTTSIGGATTPGQPITLRWSFVPDTVNAPNLTNVMAPSTLFSTMDTKFGAANRSDKLFSGTPQFVPTSTSRRVPPFSEGFGFDSKGTSGACEPFNAETLA